MLSQFLSPGKETHCYLPHQHTKPVCMVVPVIAQSSSHEAEYDTQKPLDIL